MRRRRSGFTFVELLTVLIVMGLLAGLAILKYIDLTHRAHAAQAAGDLEAVRIAAYGAWYETGKWPPEVGAGIIPPGLAPYLPNGFTFQRSTYTLDWENFAPPDGGPSAGMQVGVVVSSTDPRMQHALENTFGNKLPFTDVGGTLTFIIVGPDGNN
ncbi:MAG: type II secretion system protein [Gemmatimonadales bacterium]|jgi:prepilin-type N-terminal cleavage/methylation domain-containing protein